MALTVARAKLLSEAIEYLDFLKENNRIVSGTYELFLEKFKNADLETLQEQLNNLKNLMLCLRRDSYNCFFFGNLFVTNILLFMLLVELKTFILLSGEIRLLSQDCSSVVLIQ